MDRVCSYHLCFADPFSPALFAAALFLFALYPFALCLSYPCSVDLSFGLACPYSPGLFCPCPFDLCFADPCSADLYYLFSDRLFYPCCLYSDPYSVVVPVSFVLPISSSPSHS